MIKQKIKEIRKAWWFFTAMILVYSLLYFLSYNSFITSLDFFFDILIKVFPALVLVFLLMVLTNYFITQDIILKHLREKGIKKWVFAIIGGILSSGPIYLWYPLLADLREKGIPEGLIACFLYNRAIKIPLIPLILLYFSWGYTLILLFAMIFVSVIQGFLINKFYRR